jgi:uncharacterized protein YllA (UPF0747 family)
MMHAVTRELGGSALSRRALAGDLPQWYGTRPMGRDGWSATAEQVAEEFAGRQWLARLLPALAPSGAAADRLTAASQSGGLVVTGGQQPGLFGGPLYVLHKALTVLELADALGAVTGRPVAPVFWAATDDADFAEASHVSVVRHGKLDRLEMGSAPTVGRAMSGIPLGDLSDQMARLEEACGSAPDARAINAVRAAYVRHGTVGHAYVALLRTLLEPLGIAVLDASHATVREAAHATLVRALTHAGGIAGALGARSQTIADAGFHAQVADVPNLSLVFETLDDGTRRRVPIRSAGDVAERASPETLGPNVLLRPVVERQILPTVTYVGGPGEVAYFAQVSAVADAMDLAVPRISPRWSGTLMEPNVESILERLRATMDDFIDPHAMEGRVAREGISPRVRAAMDGLRAELDRSCEQLRADEQTSDALTRSIGTMRAGVEHRLERLERRYAAAIKQTGSQDLHDAALVRATLYPNGGPQERTLSFIPFLARYGADTVDLTRDQVRSHVAAMIQGG